MHCLSRKYLAYASLTRIRPKSLIRVIYSFHGGAGSATIWSDPLPAATVMWVGCWIKA